MEHFEQNTYHTKVVEKLKSLGPFALTAEDHKILGSTPDERLKENHKAFYEVLTDEEINNYLEGMIASQYDPDLIRNGVAQNNYEDLAVSLPFLESVGRLPEKYQPLLSELKLKDRF